MALTKLESGLAGTLGLWEIDVYVICLSQLDVQIRCISWRSLKSKKLVSDEIFRHHERKEPY